MATLHQQPGIAERLGQRRLDARCASARAMYCRCSAGPVSTSSPRLSTLPAARMPALCWSKRCAGAVAAHADVDPVRARAGGRRSRAAPGRGCERPLRCARKRERHLVGERQPVDVAHRQPLRDRGRARRHSCSSACSMRVGNSPRIHSSWMQCAPARPSAAASAAAKRSSRCARLAAASGRAAGDGEAGLRARAFTRGPRPARSRGRRAATPAPRRARRPARSARRARAIRRGPTGSRSAPARVHRRAGGS